MGFSCDVFTLSSVPVANPLGQNLYYSLVCTENPIKATAPSHVPELLNLAAGRTVGTFACEQCGVFSNVSAPVNTLGM